MTPPPVKRRSHRPSRTPRATPSRTCVSAGGPSHVRSVRSPPHRSPPTRRRAPGRPARGAAPRAGGGPGGRSERRPGRERARERTAVGRADAGADRRADGRTDGRADAPNPPPEPTAEPTAEPTVAPTPEPTSRTRADREPTPAPTEEPAPSAPPTIASDLEDYPPGGLVTLTGTGWQPGELVHITVNDDVGSTWTPLVDVTADADGAIVDSFNLPELVRRHIRGRRDRPDSGTALTHVH